MSKFVTAEEFAVWSERHTQAEVEQKARDLQNELVTELAEEIGVDREQFEQAGAQEKEIIVTAGAEQWLEQEAQREADEASNQPVDRLYISDESDDDTVEIEVPYGGALDKQLSKGMVKGSFAEDSLEGQEVVQAQFIALHPEFRPSPESGNLIRDRVVVNGHTYFSLEALETAFSELVFEGKIDIPYEFGR